MKRGRSRASSTIRKLLLLALPATLLAGAVLVLAIELWVRTHWDYSRGTPGFYESDAIRGQRLSAGYHGWFAGVPVEVNALGFRDNRQYTLEKSPGTFRILVLGDSVTFGHGATYETTYPYLVEQRLRAWRRDITWQVWNLGVPGYNTRQELSYLQEVGPIYKPDLVVVGFYPNDLMGDNMPVSPGVIRRAVSGALRAMQRHLYSFEFYKRVYLTARYRLMTRDSDRRRLEQLSDESSLLERRPDKAEEDQRLYQADYFDDEQVRDFICIGAPPVDQESEGELRPKLRAATPDVAPWLDAVHELQRLNQQGVYRVVFFINMAPELCGGQDRFYNAGSLADDAAYLEVFRKAAPAVSSARAFLHRRPSQMPGAVAHSFGNANQVKADVLFEFLRSEILPSLLPLAGGS
jgi:hypothetical protein